VFTYKYQLELGRWFYSEIHEDEKKFIRRYCEGEERPYMKEVSEEKGNETTSLS